MSLAGIRSNRGDAYQRSVALYWTVKMLLDKNISGIQVDAVSTPDDTKPVYQDDIIILYKNGDRTFIQAKINQAKHEAWKLTDTTLNKELESCKSQLLSKPNYEVHFYSRTPFGGFQRLIEESSVHPDLEAFLRDAPQGQIDTFDVITKIWDNDAATALSLIKRIRIGPQNGSSEWQDLSHELLKPTFPRANTALELIYNYVDHQHLHLADSKIVLERQDILDMLHEHGIHQALACDETKLIRSFRDFSVQGRQWVRSMGGEKIHREELTLLKQAIEQKVPSILLEDIAGGGKTCLLLDLMDDLDEQKETVSLFIKGDIFASINTLKDLEQYGLPKDFISQCAYLANRRHIVIAIDSLDVLAVGRSHNSLRCFLGMIAGLSKIPNITVVAASRSFDAKYDPLLREMKWGEVISISPLSFNDSIAPLFYKWGYTVSQLSDKLKNVLVIPQNLRLFYELLHKGMTIDEIGEHDLYDIYLQELVEKDANLGQVVLNTLQETSLGLLKLRSYEFQKRSLDVSPDQLQYLLSKQIIMEVGPNQLMFSHQTLADALRIRQAFQNGTTLLAFSTSQPQLPFIRPAVRSLIQTLKNRSPKQCIRQLREFLLSDKVSMHLKRLAVETLAEMEASGHDIALVITLSNQHPQLFRRLLERANNNSWFLLIHDQLIPNINVKKSQQNTYAIIYFLSKFFKGNEEKVVRIWHRAIDEEWLNIKNLSWLVSSELEKNKNWSIPYLDDFLKKLLENSDDDHSSLGKAICQYIEATGKGDHLLWMYITLNTKPISELDTSSELEFNCNSHDFLTENYFEERLKVSDELFNSALDYLLSFTQSNNSDFYVDFLKNTSYEKRHTHRDIYFGSSTSNFLNAVGEAMKKRCNKNDGCWKSFEPKIRVCDDLGLIYLLIESYHENIIGNVVGISALLTSKNLFKYGNLEFELGTLALAAYPYISNKTREEHQRNILNHYENKERQDYWALKGMYGDLMWVPASYRLPELFDTFVLCEKKYGTPNLLRQPNITGWSGTVRSPISIDQILNFSNNGLVNVLRHYTNENGFSDHLLGGLDSVESALSSAANQIPLKFIPIAHLLYQSNAPISSILSIIDGIASHLSHRFGNLQTPNWKELQPLPDGQALALELLSLVERYGKHDFRKYSHARAIQACSHILKDEQSVDRLCFQLWQLSTSTNPNPNEDNETESLVGKGINSVRGIAAETVLIICNDRLEKHREITSSLKQLLTRFAKDASMVVRATFLRRFPYFLSKNSEFGWQLIDIITKNGSSRLLKHLEHILYYQYHENFDLVEPYLNKLKLIDDKKSAEAWGRLATLCYLSDYISEEDLWHDLPQQNAAAKEGLGQVLIANYANKKHASKCLEGLKRLFVSQDSESIYFKFERSLSNKNTLHSVSLETINLFIEYSTSAKPREIDGVFYWLEKNVLHMPNEVLNTLEKVIERFSDGAEPVHFSQKEPLLSTLKSLLQEADLSDDEEFIDRVLAAQYWFLDKGVQDIEKLIEP